MVDEGEGSIGDGVCTRTVRLYTVEVRSHSWTPRPALM